MTNFHAVSFCFRASVEFEQNRILLEMIPISKIVFAATLAFHFWLSQMIDLEIKGFIFYPIMCVMEAFRFWIKNLMKLKVKQNYTKKIYACYHLIRTKFFHVLKLFCSILNSIISIWNCRSIKDILCSSTRIAIVDRKKINLIVRSLIENDGRKFQMIKDY